MSDRTPAGDKGTADRIEADDGGYWVRLVTKQAMHREGECMQNCLRSGAKNMLAGNEETLSSALWSLRKACGTSYALAEVGVFKTACQIGHLLGPHNHPPSPWAVRQIRHLRSLFAASDLDLYVDPDMAVIGPDGMTYRPDQAPASVQQAALAERIEHEKWAGDREAERRRAARPIMRSISGRVFVLDEVDAYPYPGFSTSWQTLLEEQAAQRARYERLGLVAPVPVPTVAIGVDTQPDPAAETPPGRFESFVEHARRYLASCLGQSYEEFTGDWNTTAEREQLALLSERARGFGLSSIPGLQVTFAGGGSSGCSRATATPRTTRDEAR